MIEIINKLIDWITYFKAKIEEIDNKLKNISTSDTTNTEEIIAIKTRLSVLEKIEP